MSGWPQVCGHMHMYMLITCERSNRTISCSVSNWISTPLAGHTHAAALLHSSGKYRLAIAARVPGSSCINDKAQQTCLLPCCQQCVEAVCIGTRGIAVRDLEICESTTHIGPYDDVSMAMIDSGVRPRVMALRRKRIGHFVCA